MKLKNLNITAGLLVLAEKKGKWWTVHFSAKTAPLSPQSQGDREGIREREREVKQGGSERKRGTGGGDMIAAARKKVKGQREGSCETTAQYLTMLRCNSHLIPTLYRVLIHSLQPLCSTYVLQSLAIVTWDTVARVA